MNARKAIFSFFGVALVMLLAIMSFNYVVDPMCYYRCSKIDPTRVNVNTYYRVGQVILGHPEAEAVMIGSSRGETTSPIWLSKMSGLKTINLSVGGTELEAKFAFLNIALKNNRLKQVIWEADFFELIPDIIDVKMKDTFALRDYLGPEFSGDKHMSLATTFTSLVDHLTFEASIAKFKKKNRRPLDFGNGSDINCEELPSKKSAESLAKEVAGDYERYRHSIFNHPASQNYWELFREKMLSLSSQGIDVIILVAPYHPTFMKNLAKDDPRLFSAHLDWVAKINGLSQPHIHILNYFNGIDGDDESNKYWDDGVHFSCRASEIMLKSAFF